ncbi:hypothetical protein DRO60_03070 [Candidatus Bathyarchaeota archaeon]|nr:MAG: hypothetical protein DRO60_03070 [Candidatus Bathyarchaeota archaeon]
MAGSGEGLAELARLREILNSIKEETPGVRALAVISYDGFVIESFMPSSVDEDLMAAMGSSVLSIAERMGIDLRLGDFELGIVCGSDGYLLLTRAGREAILILLVNKDVKLGVALYMAKRAAARVAEALEGVSIEELVAARWG